MSDGVPPLPDKRNGRPGRRADDNTLWVRPAHASARVPIGSVDVGDLPEAWARKILGLAAEVPVYSRADAVRRGEAEVSARTRKGSGRDRSRRA